MFIFQYIYSIFFPISFYTLDEISIKYQIFNFGDTDKQLILKMFNNKIEEDELVKIMNNESRPYDLLNLARYYKYVKKNNDEYNKYAFKAKNLGCMSAYDSLTHDMKENKKYQQAIDFIEEEVANGVNPNDFNLGALVNIINCSEVLGNENIKNKYNNLYIKKITKNGLFSVCKLLFYYIIRSFRYKLRLQRLWQCV